MPEIWTPPAMLPYITPFTPNGCIVGESMTPGSAAYPSANRAFYHPFRVTHPIVIKKLWWVNGTVVSGNVDVGIYDHAGTRLTSTGSTAQAGASDSQAVDITDLLLGSGMFYLAIACDNTTATFWRANSAVAALNSQGVRAQNSAFPLPATATFAAASNTAVHVYGASRRVVV